MSNKTMDSTNSISINSKYNFHNCIDTDDIDADLQQKIASTTFVYIVALAGVGKTFAGDYLEAVRGWKHIDGDIPFKQSSNPQWLDARQQLMRSGPYAERAGDAEWVQQESFKAYTDILVGLTLGGCADNAASAASNNASNNASNHNKVVLTHASYTVEQRKYCKEQLLNAGAKKVETIFLHCEFDAHMETVWKRTNRWADQGGTTVEEVMEGIGLPGIQNFESFVEVQKYMMCFWDDPDEASDAPYVTVDVTAKDVTVLDGLDAALGIVENDDGDGDGDGDNNDNDDGDNGDNEYENSNDNGNGDNKNNNTNNNNSGPGRKNLSYPELVQKIQKVDELRDQAWFDALNAATEDKDEQELARNEPRKLAARRTSLFQADKILSNVRDFDFGFDLDVDLSSSASPSTSTSTSSRGSRRLSMPAVALSASSNGRRRASFITTGKFTEL
jgi:hypothetical protein